MIATDDTESRVHLSGTRSVSLAHHMLGLANCSVTVRAGMAAADVEAATVGAPLAGGG